MRKAMSSQVCAPLPRKADRRRSCSDARPPASGSSPGTRQYEHFCPPLGAQEYTVTHQPKTKRQPVIIGQRSSPRTSTRSSGSSQGASSTPNRSPNSVGQAPQRTQSVIRPATPEAAGQALIRKTGSAPEHDFEDRKAKFRQNIIERQRISYEAFDQRKCKSSEALDKLLLDWLNNKPAKEQAPTAPRAADNRRYSTIEPREKYAAWLDKHEALEIQRTRSSGGGAAAAAVHVAEQAGRAEPAQRSPRYYEGGWEGWDQDEESEVNSSSSEETKAGAPGSTPKHNKKGAQPAREQTDFDDVFGLADLDSSSGLLLAGRDKAQPSPRLKEESPKKKAKKRPPALQFVKQITRARSKSVEDQVTIRSKTLEDDWNNLRLSGRRRKSMYGGFY